MVSLKNRVSISSVGVVDEIKGKIDQFVIVFGITHYTMDILYRPTNKPITEPSSNMNRRVPT